MLPEPRLEHRTVKIKQLVQDYRSGLIVVPEFQREYVWKKSKAPLLIDSLYRGFPISSLLLWQSDEGIRSRRADPRPSRSVPINWLIDGQQRVITLARTLHGDEGIDVMFNPVSDEFRLANVATRNDMNWFRVSDIWEDETYRRMLQNSDGSPSARKREDKFERVRTILSYEVPVVRMVDHVFDHAVSAFKRINTLGVRLKKEDIESAQVAAQHSGFIADEVIPFLQQLRSMGYSRLTIMHLFRACAFVAMPDGRSKTPLHELSRRDVLAAWKSTKRATEKAIGLLRSELGLVNMDILWSGSLIVPAIAMCDKLPPKQLNAKEVAGCIALAALAHRYSGASETALDQDLRACRSGDPVGALLKNLRSMRTSLRPVPQDFDAGLSDRNAMLAMYVACLHRGVRDFYSGGKVLLQDNVDKHHILPRAQFDLAERHRADNVANIAFVAGDANKSIGQKAPEVYLKSVGANVLSSQCIPGDEQLWRTEVAEQFLEERRVLLASSLNDYLDEAFSDRRRWYA